MGQTRSFTVKVFAALGLSLASMGKPTVGQPSGFQQGATDRQAFEDWYTALSDDYLGGATYWVNHRSSPGGASCRGSGPWEQGCLAARERLTADDARRRADPDYRAGWNSVQPGQVAAPPLPFAGGYTDAQSGYRSNQNTISGSSPKTARSQYQAAPPPPPRGVGRPNAYATGQSGVGQSATPYGGGSSNDDTVPAVVIISIVIVAIGFVLKKVMPPVWRLFQRRHVIKIANEEISSKARHLAIKKLQLVRPDYYGTVVLDRWEKEKEYFFKTTITLRVENEGLLRYLNDVKDTILADIEDAASQALPTVSDDVGGGQAYLSDPRVFDDRMDPVHYEQYCAFQLERAGWTTRATPVTGDQGADILAERGGLTLVVQCKLYSGSVGNDAVQQVIGARLHQRADLAVVVTNSSYTASAHDLAASGHVALLHHSELATFTGIAVRPVAPITAGPKATPTSPLDLE